MTTKKLTAAEAYLKQAQSKQPQVVDVTAPSGFVFRFEKPSRFALLFQIGGLPTAAADGAVSNWIDAGVIEGSGSESIPVNPAQQISEVVKLRDRVLELSHDPKLVMGRAKPENNELSVDYVSDDDLSYLFRWVAAGGEEGLGLGNFPERSDTDAVAGNGRPKRRNKAK